MKEIKRGDFTGIYSQIDGKPLFYTGQYDYMECGGLPCVWLATDIHNNLTFSRWSQQELNKRGWTIPPRPVEISKTAMQMIQKAGAVIRWTTAAERKAANTDHKRMSAYIITTAAGDFYTTGTCADVREILKAAQAAPLPKESTPATEANQDTTTGAKDGPTAPESNTAGENTTGTDKAPEGATSEAGPAADHTGTPAAETATEGPETSTAAQDTTGSDTRPPRAQEANQEPGHAAGDHSGQAADHITGPTTGNTSGAAAEAITGRTATPPQNPGHACEIAPERTERAQAEQVHATHAKRPPRAPQRATTHGRPRGHPEKTANFGRFYPLLDFPRTIFANFQGIPISVCIFGPVFDPEFWMQKRHPLGGIKISCRSRNEKNFSKKIEREVNTMGRYVTRSLDRDSYEKLVKTIRCGYEYKGVKHRPNYQIATILVLEANLGCRIGDIIALTTDSIVNDGGIWKLNITEEKTGKKRYFIVPKPIKAYIDEYCRCSGITNGRLFDIQAPAVWKQLRAATAYLEYKDTSTHSLRKMAAQTIYENTNHDIEAVAEFLNHSSINTTRRYIKRTDEQLESAIMSAVCIV